MTGRIPILDVQPAEGCGRWPAKAVVGETFTVSATVFREGHDMVNANVVLRDDKGRKGPYTQMRQGAPGTDRWHADVTPTGEGRWSFTVEAWSDPVGTWLHDATIKIEAGAAPTSVQTGGALPTGGIDPLMLLAGGFALVAGLAGLVGTRARRSA
jgi:starch synthase (maltosyl-transferring)